MNSASTKRQITPKSGRKNDNQKKWLRWSFNLQAHHVGEKAYWAFKKYSHFIDTIKFYTVIQLMHLKVFF